MILHDEILLSKKLLLAKKDILNKLNASETAAISKFDLHNSEFLYTSTTEMRVGSEAYPGHGRSPNAIVAASKSFGECLERYFAFKYLDGSLHVNPRSQQIILNSGKFETEAANVEESFPPRSLFSSNGWALHFNEPAAIRNAVNEAVERTLLQINFIVEGWRGFINETSLNFFGRSIRYWLTRQSLFGVRGGVVDCKMLNHDGHTFGYFIHPSSSAFSVDLYLHAMFEALEPSIFLDQNPYFVPNSRDSIEIAQVEMAKRPSDSIFALGPAPRQKMRPPQEFQASVRSFSLSEVLGVDFPIYIAWCFGGNSIPLIVKGSLDQEGRNYLAARLNCYAISYEETYELPII